MSFSEMLLPEFDQEMSNTRKMLESVPDGKFDFQPHAKSMTLARLANHVAEMGNWAASTLDTEVLEIPADYKPDIAGSRAGLLEKFDKGVAAGRAKIASATAADWAKIWTFKFAGKEIMSMPRTAVMRGVVMNHMIHHRAQLGVYLRLLDVKVPGMYGPSADESMF